MPFEGTAPPRMASHERPEQHREGKKCRHEEQHCHGERHAVARSSVPKIWRPDVHILGCAPAATRIAQRLIKLRIGWRWSYLC